MSAFYDYVRGLSDDVPAGYTEAGMRLYRHLVWLGAEQLLAAHFSQVKTTLGQEAWKTLIEAFVRQSNWSSHFYGDLKNEFMAFLARESA